MRREVARQHFTHAVPGPLVNRRSSGVEPIIGAESVADFWVDVFGLHK